MQRLYEIFCMFGWLFLPLKILLILWFLDIAIYFFQWYRESIYVKSNGF